MLNPLVYLFLRAGVLCSSPGLSPPRMMMQATAYHHPMLLAMPSPADNINDEGDDGWDYSQPLLFTQPTPRGLPPLPADDSFDSVVDDTAAEYAAVAAAAVVATASEVTDSPPWWWRQRGGGAGQHGGGDQQGNGVCIAVLAAAA
jgi:hypothetical protein